MNGTTGACAVAAATRPHEGRGATGLAAPLCAVALGLLLLYAAGFATTEALHNGAHDARHGAGFACH